MAIHRSLGFGAFNRSHWAGLSKAGPHPGPEWRNQTGRMRRNQISNTISKKIAPGGPEEDLSEMRVARIERSGDISFIKKKQ